MKITIIADCHINKSMYKGTLDKDYPSLPFRTVDFMKSFHHIVSQNVKSIKPDLVVIAGDVYDTYDPSNESRAFFYKELTKFVKSNIPVIILVGNHDVCRKHHALSPVKSLELNNVTIIEEPTFMEYKDKVFMLFPYSLQVERNEISIKQQFDDFMASNKEKIDNNPKYKDMTKMFFGHFGVKGATLKTYDDGDEKTKKYVNSSNKDIGVSDLDQLDVDYVFLGDYHQHQILPTKNNIAMDTGRIEKTDISEIDQKKGYIVYDDDSDIDKVMGKAKFIEYPKCRPMLDLQGDIDEIYNQFNSLDYDKHIGAIVRLKFKGKKSKLIAFSAATDDLKKQINHKINAVYVYMEQDVIQDEESIETSRNASRLELDILEHGHLNDELVLKVVEELIVEKEADLNEQQDLIKIAREIYQETLN